MATLVSRISDLVVAVRTKINAMMPRLIPSGGIAGQVLVKNSSTDYDTAWGRRTVFFSGTTDANGLATLTFSPTFTTTPYIEGQVTQTNSSTARMTSVEVVNPGTSGCTIKTMRHAVTGVLLLNTQVPGAEVYPNAPYMVRVTGI